jgi:hypothetical protein
MNKEHEIAKIELSKKLKRQARIFEEKAPSAENPEVEYCRARLTWVFDEQLKGVDTPRNLSRMRENIQCVWTGDICKYCPEDCNSIN